MGWKYSELTQKQRNNHNKNSSLCISLSIFQTCFIVSFFVGCVRRFIYWISSILSRHKLKKKNTTITIKALQKRESRMSESENSKDVALLYERYKIIIFTAFNSSLFFWSCFCFAYVLFYSIFIHCKKIHKAKPADWSRLECFETTQYINMLYIAAVFVVVLRVFFLPQPFYPLQQSDSKR